MSLTNRYSCALNPVQHYAESVRAENHLANKVVSILSLTRTSSYWNVSDALHLLFIILAVLQSAALAASLMHSDVTSRMDWRGIVIKAVLACMVYFSEIRPDVQLIWHQARIILKAHLVKHFWCHRHCCWSKLAKIRKQIQAMPGKMILTGGETTLVRTRHSSCLGT